MANDEDPQIVVYVNGVKNATESDALLSKFAIKLVGPGGEELELIGHSESQRENERIVRYVFKKPPTT